MAFAFEDDDDFEEPLNITEPLKRLSRDLVQAAATLSDKEARYLVDSYYMMQDTRKRANNQIRSMKGEPHQLLGWVSGHATVIETQIKRALHSYAQAHPIGRYIMSLYGFGPCIAAGIIAHIDIDRSRTAGNIWSFAGLNPEQKWEKKQKRPWNASLKTLSWHIGQSAMKFSGKPQSYYGPFYRKRKEFEVRVNNSGRHAELAAYILTQKNWKPTTDAYKAMSNGKLPDAHVDARARRYVTKLFLSHMHLVWTFLEKDQLPPKPYAIVHKGHAHFIPPPDMEKVAGLEERMRAEGWL